MEENKTPEQPEAEPQPERVFMAQNSIQIGSELIMTSSNFDVDHLMGLAITLLENKNVKDLLQLSKTKRLNGGFGHHD